MPRAPDSGSTDWARIVALYDLLLQATPSPVVELNRAVAIAMRDGPQVGLGLIEAILARGELADYHLAHAARADLCRRLGRIAEARAVLRAGAGAQRPGTRATLPRRPVAQPFSVILRMKRISRAKRQAVPPPVAANRR